MRKSGVFGKTVTSRIRATMKPDESEASEIFNKLKKNRVCPGNAGARIEVLSVVKLQHSSSLPTVSYSFTTEMLMQAFFSREPNCKTKREKPENFLREGKRGLMKENNYTAPGSLPIKLKIRNRTREKGTSP